MTELMRTPGQAPMLPGAVRAGNLVYTSGVASASLMTGGSPGFAEQAAEAMAALLQVLADAGATPADVVKLEAFLASPDDFAAWNEVFLQVWPEPGPARTTLISGFAMPSMLIELQAVAIV